MVTDCVGSVPVSWRVYNGEEKANMAIRPNTGSRAQLTLGELVELRKRLAAMPIHELEIYYKASHNACRYTGTHPASPRLMQEFVQGWREMAKRVR
jgi:hypothetical protein